MATLRNKKKLVTLNKESCEDHPRSNVAQNSNAPRSQEDYITQVSEETEWRVTKKLSQEFSRTENRILGALARLDDFLMNPLTQGHSGPAPETSRNALSTNQGTNEDNSQSDPHSEAGFFHNQMTRNCGPEDAHDMVTGVTEQNRNLHDMVAGVHEEVTYWSPSTSSGKPRKTSLTVICNSAVRKLLQRLKQTKFCWPFSSWQTTTILQFSITILTEFPNCQCCSRQRCPRSTGNLKSSICFEIFSKRASESIISWR